MHFAWKLKTEKKYSAQRDCHQPSSYSKENKRTNANVPPIHVFYVWFSCREKRRSWPIFIFSQSSSQWRQKMIKRAECQFAPEPAKSKSRVLMLMAHEEVNVGVKPGSAARLEHRFIYLVHKLIGYRGGAMTMTQFRWFARRWQNLANWIKQTSVWMNDRLHTWSSSSFVRGFRSVQ